MIDIRADSIIYQSQIYYRDLVNSLVRKKGLGKALDSQWEKADLIGNYLESLNYIDRLTEDTDITNVNFILECLIKLCELNQYPVGSPIVASPTPAVLVGIQGPAGAKGNPGAAGTTGLATDFSVISTSISTIIDSFDISDAYAARWDYWVKEAGGAQRVSSILGHWLADGSYDLADQGADDLDGDTSGIEFDISITGTTVQLIATITSGTWNIIGTRYFIPNNGNGSGPISDVLPDGTVFIGNNLNVATSRTISGAFTITNLGVASLTPGIIVNADINTSAAIATTKLAALTPNIIPITNGSGFLTSSALSPTTLGYVDIGSSLTGLLNTKLTDPTTTVGDLIIRNGANTIDRLSIGSAGQVLTVSGGVPTWQDPAGTLNTVVVDIGDWDMDTTSFVTITHGIADYKKIRSITVVIRDDSDTDYRPLLINSFLTGANNGGSINQISSTTINISRINSGFYDDPAYNSTGYNRGWITIMYSN